MFLPLPSLTYILFPIQPDLQPFATIFPFFLCTYPCSSLSGVPTSNPNSYYINSCNSSCTVVWLLTRITTHSPCSKLSPLALLLIVIFILAPISLPCVLCTSDLHSSKTLGLDCQQERDTQVLRQHPLGPIVELRSLRELHQSSKFWQYNQTPTCWVSLRAVILTLVPSGSPSSYPPPCHVVLPSVLLPVTVDNLNSSIAPPLVIRLAPLHRHNLHALWALLWAHLPQIGVIMPL